MARIGIVGGSGYTGAELLRLCAGHPEFEVAWATGDSHAGAAVSDVYPSLAPAYATMAFRRFEPLLAEEVDLMFLALPHGESQRIVPLVWGKGAKLVDLSADFRLADPAVYRRWYGSDHTCTELLGSFAYGLPEHNRHAIAQAVAVAAPGCYPTAATLALAPLVQSGLIERDGVIVDGVSGVSGAGRGLKASSHFATANEDFCAYGLLDHRHTPEIEQASGASVLFTPHLAPMTRGILATCYARPARPVYTEDLLGELSAAYCDEPFVVVSKRSPSTKATWGSNSVHLTARFDERTGWVVLLAAIDNLIKGAAGQATQCANLMLGLAEQAGLSAVGVYP